MVQKRIQVQIWPPHDLQHADLPTEAKKTKLIISSDLSKRPSKEEGPLKDTKS